MLILLRGSQSVGISGRLGVPACSHGEHPAEAVASSGLQLSNPGQEAEVPTGVLEIPQRGIIKGGRSYRSI